MVVGENESTATKKAGESMVISIAMAMQRYDAGGAVHVQVGQKLLNCYIFKSFYERSSLANFHVST
jgi:hypothetical protein